MLGAILVCTKVQSAVSYFVSFEYDKVEEQNPTGGMDVSNKHLPFLLHSCSVNINHPKVIITKNSTSTRVAR